MRRQKLRIKRWFNFIFVVCLMGLAGTVTAYANEQTVRVAFFPMEGYHIIEEDGSFGGMDVEYLETISEYTDWKLEYVICESWEDALQKLSDKEVDLVGSAQYSSARAEIYDYADLSSGYTYGVIATNSDSTIAYEDFEAMRDITFGVVKNYVRYNEFIQYLNANNITEPRILQYETTEELQAALDAGEVDAFVHTFMEIKEGQRLIGRFAPRPIYYITYKGNVGILHELNEAIADVKMSRPELETDLMNQFYESRWDKTVIFSTDEKKYMEEKKSLNIGYMDGYYPFSYEEDGEFKGLSREVFEEGLKATGLKLNYYKMESQSAAEVALEQGTIDVLAYAVNIAGVKENAALSELDAYAQIPLVLVVQKGKGYEDIKTLATVPQLVTEAERILGVEDMNVLSGTTVEACFMLIIKGDADGALCDGYLAEHLMSTDDTYSTLEINNVLNGVNKVYSVIRKEETSELKDILNKVIVPLDTKRINEYTLKENKYPLVSISLFIRNNSLKIFGAMIVIILVIITVAIHMIRDSHKIQRLMYKDTGMDIWNLNYLLYAGEKLKRTTKKRYAVVCLKIIELRRYNVVYGWDAGEALLSIVKKVLQNYVDEKEEIYARSYGDRFVLLLTWENQELFLQRLREMQGLVETKIYEATENHMSLHMGVHFLTEDGESLKLSVGYANQALEVTGNSNTSEIKVYDAPFEAMIRERHDREKLLDSVKVEESFVAYYQTKVDVRSNQVVGAEALIRFKDPTANGAIRSPWFFVPYYEQTGRVVELDFFVLEEVCKLLRRRMDEGKPVVPISCNFSRMHFSNDDFPERVEAVIDKYKVAKNLIEVEITETLVVDEVQQNVKKSIDSLIEKGIHLSIDDFGSGYSSLGVFEQIPASVVKLDRSFLLNHNDHDRQVRIMKSIVKLTHDLGAQVVCEGVENAEHVYLMKEIEAYVAQGYFYCRPMPEEEFEEHLDLLEMNFHEKENLKKESIG